LDRGKPAELRNRQLPSEIADGIGGAGLFSDGKFSFYPSASALWALQPAEMVRDAYNWTSKLIAPYGIEAPPFPYLGGAGRDLDSDITGFRSKEYPSFRMDLHKRLDIVRALKQPIAKVLVGARVAGLSRRENGHLEVSFSIDGESSVSPPEIIEAKAAVIATGRLGAIHLLRWLDIPKTFRRVELGVRIEQPQESFFLRDASGLDPKLIALEADGIEWRTFCCCRGGEIVEVLSDGILGVAGRSDGSPTNRSNAAFHVRILDANVADVSSWIPRIENRGRHFTLHLDTIAGEGPLKEALVETFGNEIAMHLLVGLAKLVEHFDISGPLSISGPSIEGVGYYPTVDSSLKIPGYPIWLPGDVAGLFRGLTAALVSGHFAGLQCAEYLCAS